MIWRTDNGPDNPKALTDLLEDDGIDHQHTGAKASQQNGGAVIRIKGVEFKVQSQLTWPRAPLAWRGKPALYTFTTMNCTCSLSNTDNLVPIIIMYIRP